MTSPQDSTTNNSKAQVSSTISPRHRTESQDKVPFNLVDQSLIPMIAEDENEDLASESSNFIKTIGKTTPDDRLIGKPSFLGGND